MAEFETTAPEQEVANSSFFKAFSQGIKLSKINSNLKQAINITAFLGKLQQLGLVRIVYNPSTDKEPLVKLTEKGKHQAIELLLSLSIKD